MPNTVRKILFFGNFATFIGLYLLLSKYLLRENLPGKLCLTSKASFVADHHSSQSNQHYRSVPRQFYTLSSGRISSFHPNSMKMPLERHIQAISQTACPTICNSTLLYTLYRGGCGSCHVTRQLHDREECWNGFVQWFLRLFQCQVNGISHKSYISYFKISFKQLFGTIL